MNFPRGSTDFVHALPVSPQLPYDLNDGHHISTLRALDFGLLSSPSFANLLSNNTSIRIVICRNNHFISCIYSPYSPYYFVTHIDIAFAFVHTWTVYTLQLKGRVDEEQFSLASCGPLVSTLSSESLLSFVVSQFAQRLQARDQHVLADKLTHLKRVSYSPLVRES